MDFDDRTRVPWPNRKSVEWHFRKLSEWWDAEHQFAGLPNACLTQLLAMPHATRGALRERAQGWKWWMPHFLLALPRGGYGALFLRIACKGRDGDSMNLEERDVAEQLRLAGNCVVVCANWLEAVDVITEYANGNMVRPAEE